MNYFSHPSRSRWAVILIFIWLTTYLSQNTVLAFDAKPETNVLAPLTVHDYWPQESLIHKIALQIEKISLNRNGNWHLGNLLYKVESPHPSVTLDGSLIRSTSGQNISRNITVDGETMTLITTKKSKDLAKLRALLKRESSLATRTVGEKSILVRLVGTYVPSGNKKARNRDFSQNIARSLSKSNIHNQKFISKASPRPQPILDRWRLFRPLQNLFNFPILRPQYLISIAAVIAVLVTINPVWAQQPEIINRASNWVETISKTPTGLPPSHISLKGENNAAFTYDLSVTALFHYIAENPEDGRHILLWFAKRYSTISDQELSNKKDGNSVYGIFRQLTSPNQTELRTIVNGISVKDTSLQGAGAVEWFSDGGPQFWLATAALYALEKDPNLNDQDKAYLEKMVQGIVDLGHSLMNDETVLAAGLKGQGVGGALQRDRLGHAENIWDFIALLRLSAKYWPDKAGDYLASENLILGQLKARGLFQQADGDLPYFIQGFDPLNQLGYADKNGRNTQVPTDVMSWGVLALGVDTVDGLWGNGASYGFFKKLVRDHLVMKPYTRPDGVQVVTIGADYSNPANADFQTEREGIKTLISDEWTAGVIVFFDALAQDLWKKGERDKALEVYYTSQALRHFMKERASQYGQLAYWEYATHPRRATGFGWNSPKAPGGSLAGLWAAFALLEKPFNPFTFESIDLSPLRNQVDNEQTSINRGIEIILSQMGTEKWRRQGDPTALNVPVFGSPVLVPEILRESQKGISGERGELENQQTSWLNFSSLQSFKKGETLVIYIDNQNAKNLVVRAISRPDGSTQTQENIIGVFPVENGRITIPLGKDYNDIVQISVHGGENAFGYGLSNQNGWAKVNYIENWPASIAIDQIKVLDRGPQSFQGSVDGHSGWKNSWWLADQKFSLNQGDTLKIKVKFHNEGGAPINYVAVGIFFEGREQILGAFPITSTTNRTQGEVSIPIPYNMSNIEKIVVYGGQGDQGQVQTLAIPGAPGLDQMKNNPPNGWAMIQPEITIKTKSKSKIDSSA